MTSLPQNLKDIMQKFGATMGPPESYETIRGKVPAIVGTKARQILSQIKGTTGLYYGYEEYFSDDDGNNYVAKIEPHYDNHPKGSGPPFWHIGVSVYRQKKDAIKLAEAEAVIEGEETETTEEEASSQEEVAAEENKEDSCG